MYLDILHVLVVVTVYTAKMYGYVAEPGQVEECDGVSFTVEVFFPLLSCDHLSWTGIV